MRMFSYFFSYAVWDHIAVQGQCFHIKVDEFSGVPKADSLFFSSSSCLSKSSDSFDEMTVKMLVGHVPC